MQMRVRWGRESRRIVGRILLAYEHKSISSLSCISQDVISVVVQMIKLPGIIYNNFLERSNYGECRKWCVSGKRLAGNAWNEYDGMAF